MTRKTAIVGFSYLAGLFLASFLPLFVLYPLIAALTASGICLICVKGKSTERKKYSLICISAAVGMLLLCFYNTAVKNRVTGFSGIHYEGGAVITDAQYYSGGSTFYTAKITLPDGKQGKAGFFSYDESDLVRGDRITLSGNISLPDSGGFFDSAKYCDSLGVHIILKDITISDIEVADGITERLHSFRSGFISKIRRYAGGDEAELIIGMTFGKSFSDMNAGTENCLFRSGIGHITAVSGIHMSVCAAVVSAVLTLLSCPKRLRVLFMALSCSAFVLLADMTPSVMRSFIMIMIVYSADLFNRKGDPLTSLAAAVILLTVPAPYTASSPAFLLSVSGVWGAAVLSPFVTARLEDLINRHKNDDNRKKLPFAASSFITAVCASAAVFPVSLSAFDEVSVIAPLTNLLLGPLCSFAVSLCIISALAGAFVSPAVLIKITEFICGIIIKAAVFIGSSQAAVIPADSTVIKVILIVLVIAAAVMMIFVKDRTYAVLGMSFCLLGGIIAATVINALPDDRVTEAVLTDGRGAVCIVYSDEFTFVADFTGKKSYAKAVKSYLSRKGIANPDIIVIDKNNPKSCGYYSDIYPISRIITEDSADFLTYTPERDIIKCGDLSFIPHERYAVISVNGTTTAVINGKVNTDEQFDHAVINCHTSVDAQSGHYIITDEDFDGLLPAQSETVFCETVSFTLSPKGE